MPNVKHINPVGSLSEAFHRKGERLPVQSFTQTTLESELQSKGVRGISITFERLDIDGSSPRILVMRYRDERRNYGGGPKNVHLIIERHEGAKIEFHRRYEAGLEDGRPVLIPTFTMTGGTIPEKYRGVDYVDLTFLLARAFGLTNVPVDFESEILESKSLGHEFDLVKSFFTGAYASREDVTSWLRRALSEMEKPSL